MRSWMDRAEPPWDRGLAPWLALGLALSCRPARPSEPQPTALVVAEAPPEPTPADDPPASAPILAEEETRCTMEARVVSIDKVSSCWVDLPDVGAQGVIETRCGDGPATLRFGKHEYRGSVVSGHFEERHQTRFDFSDGCEWQSRQTVSGAAPGELLIDYTEEPLSQGQCASPCTATARVALTR